MTNSVFSYDEVSDTLYVSFEPGAMGTGIELTDHIILRVNKSDRKAIGLTFLEYSLLAQQTEVGPRNFPLSGLIQLSSELRELVVAVLRTAPVNEFLSLAAYTPSMAETIPVVSIRPIPALAEEA